MTKLSPKSVPESLPESSELTVASSPSLDTTTIQDLRSRLGQIDGVESVWIDEAAGVVGLLCHPAARARPIRRSAEDAIGECGLDPAHIFLETVVRTSDVPQYRVRFVQAERIPTADKNVEIRVTLDWNGQMFTASAQGESGVLIELRTAAVAALDALNQIVSEPLGVRILGVKQVRAFDSELIVVSLYRSGSQPQRFVGAVTTGEDPLRAAAVSVLNGLNRMLGSYLAIL